MDLSSVDAINWLVNEQLTHPSLTQEEKLHLFDRAAVLARRGLSHTPPPQLSCRSVSGKRVALAHPGAARSGWVTDISVCAPPPFEAAPAWLAQLSLGTLHVAMAVCHEWRRAAREDVRFHTLRVRAPLQAAEAQAADHLPSELDLSTAQAARFTDVALRLSLSAAGPLLSSLTLHHLPAITASGLASLCLLPKLDTISVTNCIKVDAHQLCAHLPPSVRTVRLLGCSIGRSALDQLLARGFDELDMFACKQCDGVTHESLRASCTRCPTEYCHDCDKVYFCSRCEQDVCDHCVDRTFCELCNNLMCDCAPPTVCVVCGGEVCQACEASRMVTCSNCQGAFCGGHDVFDCDCADSCATACAGCVHLTMPACSRCGDRFYAPNHEIDTIFTRCDLPGCEALVCTPCLESNNSNWKRCAGCDVLHCPECANEVCVDVAAQMAVCACEDLPAWRCMGCMSCCAQCKRCLPASGPGSHCAECEDTCSTAWGDSATLWDF